MMSRKRTSPHQLQAAAHDAAGFVDSRLVDRDDRPPLRRDDWREVARKLGQRLMPVMVLAAAAVLGLAAVAMA